MGVVTLGRLVLPRGGDVPTHQLPCDVRGIDALCGEAEDQLHNLCRLRVRLHASVHTLAVAVGTDFALIFPALHLGVLRAFRLDGHILAVILVDEVLESHVHAAGVALMMVAVVIIADGDEARMEQRKDPFHEIAGFDAVAPKAGEILDDDAVDFVGPHHFK